MAKSNTTAEVTEEKKSENEQSPKFSVEKLAANCRQLFGVSSCTFAGATHGMTGEYTVTEMKAHIEKWGRTEVK